MGSQVLSCSNDIGHPAEPVCRRREAIVEPVGTEQVSTRLTAYTSSARSSRMLRSLTVVQQHVYLPRRAVPVAVSTCHCFSLSPFWSGQSVAVLVSPFWFVAVLTIPDREQMFDAGTAR